MVLIVSKGLLISSIIYKVCKEGRAIKIRIIAGRMVQIISISWTFIIFVWISLVVNISIIIYKTKELIRKIIIRVWSWK